MMRDLKLLLIEDSALDAELILDVLQRSGFRTTCVRVESEPALRQELASGDWEIILSDHGILALNSLRALEVVDDMDVTTPVVVVSGTIGEEATVAALHAGACDVVLKTNLSRLGPILRRELRDHQDRCHRTRLEAQLRHDAFHDELTGLPNRRLALDRAEQMLHRARRGNLAVGVLYIDLDGFKQINDTFGHAAGDELLQLLATRLRGVLRASDTAARLSGDEFVVLIEGGTDKHMSELVAQRLLRALREPYDLAAAGGRPLTVTATIGIATQVRDTADQLLRDADVALYTAKRSGRDQCAFFTPSMKMEVNGSDRRPPLQHSDTTQPETDERSVG